MATHETKKRAYGDVARWCEQPDLSEDDTDPGYSSGLDDGTDHSGIPRVRSSIPGKT